MLLVILRSCLPSISLWQSFSMARTADFPPCGREERSTLYLLNQAHLSQAPDHIRTRRGCRGYLFHSDDTGGTKRFRKGQGTHSVIGRVQNENPGVLTIRLGAQSTIQGRISLWEIESVVVAGLLGWKRATWPRSRVGGAVIAGLHVMGTGEGPRHQVLWCPYSPGSLSEVCLQYVLSTHSLPQFYSILRFPAVKHIQVHLIFGDFKAITCSKAPVQPISFIRPHDPHWLSAGSIQTALGSRLWSDYSAKTDLADFTHDHLQPLLFLFLISSFFKTFSVLVLQLISFGGLFCSI